MSTDSTRDSANSMSPSLENRFTAGTSGEQRHLSTDSTRDSGIDSDDPQNTSLAAYLPRKIYISVSFFFHKINDNVLLIFQQISTMC